MKKYFNEKRNLQNGAYVRIIITGNIYKNKLWKGIQRNKNKGKMAGL